MLLPSSRSKPDQMLAESSRLLGGKRFRAGERASEFYEIAEPRLRRRRFTVQLVAIERQPRLHPQRIARSESARQHALLTAGIQQSLEKPGRVGCRGEKFKAVFAGISGPRDQAPYSRNYAAGGAELFNAVERSFGDTSA